MKVNYSFTQARKKHIFKAFTKIWGFYCTLIFMILMGFLFVLNSQISHLKNEQNISNDEQAILRGKIASLQLEYQRIQVELKILEVLDKNNSNLRMQITNILRMIPEQISLNSLNIDNDSLYMSGVTLGKDIFINSLQLPLKSIFDKSDASFSAIGNGWYNFQSMSKIESSQKLEDRAQDNLKKKVMQ